MFSPSSSDLGTVQVNESFSYNITYTYEDPFTLTEVYSPIVLTVSQKALNSLTNTLESGFSSLPSTITVSGGSFSGYLSASVFDRSSLSYTLKSNETQTVTLDGKIVPNFWTAVDSRKPQIGHIYSFKPDPRSAVYYYINALATATNAQKQYVLTVIRHSYTPDAQELRRRV